MGVGAIPALKVQEQPHRDHRAVAKDCRRTAVAVTASLVLRGSTAQMNVQARLSRAILIINEKTLKLFSDPWESSTKHSKLSINLLSKKKPSKVSTWHITA